MTDTAEALDPGLAEAQALLSMIGTGLLEATYQRWLELTDGDEQFIEIELGHLISSGSFESEACVPLLEGYIALVAKEDAETERDEATIYQTGKQAIRAYMEAEAAEGQKKVAVRDIKSEIKSALGLDVPHTYTAEDFVVPPPPPVRRAKRQHETSPVPAPQTDEARMKNLGKANSTRTRHAEIKASLHRGDISLEEALDDPDTDTLEISKLLLSVYGVGSARVRALLKTVNLASESEVGALTPDEKAQLAALIPPARRHKHAKSNKTREQSIESLNKGNSVRLYRAGLKRKLAAKEMTAAELFEDEMGAGMKLGEMLKCLPARGRPKTGKNISESNGLRDSVLRQTGLRGDKRCRDLTERQRRQVLEILVKRGLN